MIPNRLKKGDFVAVIAPSNHVGEDDFIYMKKTEKGGACCEDFIL